MTKMTYTVALDVAINAVEDEAVKEKLTALRAQIEKKNSADRKPTKAQAENAELKDRMVEALTEQMTATEVANAFGISINKSTALLTAMVKAGSLVRTVEKRKAYFSPSEGEGAQYLEREVAM